MGGLTRRDDLSSPQGSISFQNGLIESSTSRSRRVDIARRSQMAVRAKSPKCCRKCSRRCGRRGSPRRQLLTPCASIPRDIDELGVRPGADESRWCSALAEIEADHGHRSPSLSSKDCAILVRWPRRKAVENLADLLYEFLPRQREHTRPAFRSLVAQRASASPGPAEAHGRGSLNLLEVDP